MINEEEIKKDFPIFKHLPHLTYLDSAATSLKPQLVIDAVTEYYSQYSANIFRGIYDISEKATDAYEKTRMAVKEFIGAYSEKEIIFTRNATESINLFVDGIQGFFREGDEIATTITEHHSNFVPWQQMALKKNLAFKVISSLQFEISHLNLNITENTKVLAITYVSNVLGTVNPIKAIIKKAKKINPGIIVLVDGSQAVPHMKVDVLNLGCDAFVFSSHKMFGPTGVGVLWAKKELLEKLTLYQYGGGMIRSVSIKTTQFADLPHRFEAGTPHIAGVIALQKAILYLNKIGLDSIYQHEVTLAQILFDRLCDIFGKKIEMIGPSKRESGIVSFSLKGIHAHDVAQLLSEDAIALRAGHHCTMPLHKYMGIDASVRASFSVYNSEKDIAKLITSLQKIFHIFK